MIEPVFSQEERGEANQRPQLPRRSPDRIWAAAATESRCVMCGVHTKPGESEVEVEYDLEGGSVTQTYRLHARCFFVLERGGGISTELKPR